MNANLKGEELINIYITSSTKWEKRESLEKGGTKQGQIDEMGNSGEEEK